MLLNPKQFQASQHQLIFIIHNPTIHNVITYIVINILHNHKYIIIIIEFIQVQPNMAMHKYKVYMVSK
jgi:hypothetical protein